jgi:ubiquinone/menaquinone biosynthesis C-methylase UbiE
MMQPYSVLAPLYDRLMAHIEYGKWVSFIHDIIASYCHTSTPTVFEIGGGTGVLGRILLDQGMRYTGSDRSTGMCVQAHARGVPFIAADARALPLKRDRTFDVALFLYDGINYLPSINDYRRVFEEVHAALNSSGLFLFDITTQANSMTNFSDFLDASDCAEGYYIRRSYYHPCDAVQYNDFTVFKCVHESGSPEMYKRFDERHAQKVLPVKDVAAAVPRELFDTVGMWDNFSFRHWSTRSDRVHFLLQKTDA